MSDAIEVGVVMGSNSDWETMRHGVEILQQFGIAHEARVVSAHRMPDALFAYAQAAAARGLAAIIAGAGGAAHLPGMLAAKTTVPVLGVPVASRHLQGVDSLYSIVQMPRGVPVATFAIGNAGAANAALFAIAMLALGRPRLRAQLDAFRQQQTALAEGMTLPPPGAAQMDAQPQTLGHASGQAPGHATGTSTSHAPATTFSGMPGGAPISPFSPQGGGAL